VAQTLPLVSLPFYFQEILQFSPVKTGLLMAPWPVGVAAGRPARGWFARRMPVSTLAGSGLLVMSAGLIAMLCLPGDSSAVMIGLRLGICGVGFGFFQGTQHPTRADVKRRHHGAAVSRKTKHGDQSGAHYQKTASCKRGNRHTVGEPARERGGRCDPDRPGGHEQSCLDRTELQIS